MEKVMKPLVTAVITTYKRKPDIVRRALASIVAQTYEKLEIIVVNDCPTDKKLVRQIEELIEDYINVREIQYIVVETNGGACKARNKALKCARGEYIAFLDDDDEWIENKIELQISAIQKNPDAVIVYSNALIRYSNVKKEHLRFKSIQPEGNIFFGNLAKNNIGSCSFPLFKTTNLRAIGGFREDMPALQDWELYLRLLKENRAAYVHEPVAIYYFYEGERISSHPENRILAYENIHKEFREELMKNRESASAFYLMGTYFYSIQGDMKKAMQYYIDGVRLKPLCIRRNIKDFFLMIGRIVIKPRNV